MAAASTAVAAIPAGETVASQCHACFGSGRIAGSSRPCPYGCEAPDVRELRLLRSALHEIASLAGDTAYSFGDSHDEQRAAIFNACCHALNGKEIKADDYRTKR